MTGIAARCVMLARRLKWLFNLAVPGNVGIGCQIHPMARFEGHVGNVRLGNNVIISAYALIYCHKNGSIEIGDGSYIGDGAIVHTGKKDGRVLIGRNCTVQAYSTVFGHGGCRIGDFVRIGPRTVIIPANHVFEDANTPIYQQGLTRQGISVGNDVWIGAGVEILDGVTVGSGAVIAAGAVVNRSVDEMTIVGGVPAKKIGMRGEAPSVAGE